jgi:secreted trypsin-like serine protease
MNRIASLSLVAVSSLFVAACSPDQQTASEEPALEAQPATATGARIVGGSLFADLPAVGALTYEGQEHCTATLIAPRKLVTAAHCVLGFLPSHMQFVIGADMSKPEATLRVASLQAHPLYDPNAINNDIAIVTLAEDAPVQPLAVLDKMDSTYVGKSLLFVGYGVTDGYAQTGEGMKRAVWMDVSKLSPSQFQYNDTTRNTCNGDSGGPAFYRDSAGTYFVAGVTSYGDAHCTQYGVDTRADKYLSFLGVSGEKPADAASSDDRADADAGAGCGSESFTGRCDGNTVVWCDNDKVYKSDCAAEAKTCLFDDTDRYYGCGELPVKVDDPCNGESFSGRCDGNTLVWCESNQVFTLDCGGKNASCDWDGSNSYYNCL